MGRSTSIHCTIARFALILHFCAGMQASEAAESISTPQIENRLQPLTDELRKHCPISEPDNQAAFESCKKFLFNQSLVKQMMAQPIILWGRQTDASLPLKETNLTQFSPDILSGLYLPLFMFNGQFKVSFNEKEKLYQASLGAAFRNRLQPGQFPYPFWHDANKWSVYENARGILLWIDPYTARIRAIQFTAAGDPVAGVSIDKASPPAFDGHWLWTDAKGQTQPAVTLFDGLYRSDNPYKPQLDKTYREFALALRESQCLSCHVPNNPEKMKRLVLLQSPAHAAGEIQRVLKSVREKKMPLDDLGVEKELDPALMKVLLEKGGEFEKVVNSARNWERQQGTTN
jgi:hypothetical protein